MYKDKDINVKANIKTFRNLKPSIEEFLKIVKDENLNLSQSDYYDFTNPDENNFKFSYVPSDHPNLSEEQILKVMWVRSVNKKVVQIKRDYQKKQQQEFLKEQHKKITGKDFKPAPPKDNFSWNFNFKIETIEDNAKAILDFNPLYYDDNKQWWCWNKIKWVKVLPTDIIEFTKKVFDANGLSNSNNRVTLLNALMDESRSRKPLNPPDTLVQFNSKIYDIASDKVLEPTPDYFFKTVIPIDIGNSEETPFTDKIFKEWLPEDYESLYEILAFSISPQNFMDIFFFMVGSGSNGKGVFTSVLRDFIGAENCVEQNIDLISDPKQRFQTADLKDKLVCNLGDGNFGILKETKLLKEMSGNKDYLKAEYKGSNNKEYFLSKATVVGSFNTLPQTVDKTPGFYRRSHVTEFKKQFDGKTDLNNSMFKKEYPNLALKSLNRIKEIYKTREVKNWGEVEDRKEKYERLSDLISQFMNSQMVEDIKGCFTKTKFHSEYQKWAIKNGRNEFHFKECIERLQSKGLDYGAKHVFKSDSGHIWTTLKDVPEDLTVTDEKGELLLLQRTQIRVFQGYSFKNQRK